MNASKSILLAGLFAIITTEFIPAQNTPTPTTTVEPDPVKEPDVATLEQGYKAAADALSQELTEAVKKPEVSRAVLTRLSKATETMNDMTRREYRVLKKPKPKDFASPAQLQLISVTNQPPSLRQDTQDLYDRFKSSVVVRIALLDANGKETSGSVAVTIPVAASPTMKWAFPSAAQVLEKATEKCNSRADLLRDLAIAR